jgi:hypothetical protein
MLHDDADEVCGLGINDGYPKRKASISWSKKSFSEIRKSYISSDTTLL